MKKAIYTFGLFSMMMLLTSFTTNTSTATSTAATTIEEDHTDTGGTILLTKGAGRKADVTIKNDSNSDRFANMQSSSMLSINNSLKKID